MQVWKYTLQVGKNVRTMPADALPLHVHGQKGFVTLWVLVSPEAPRTSRVFSVVGTGWNVDVEHPRYIGTAESGTCVWHVFAEGSSNA